MNALIWRIALRNVLAHRVKSVIVGVIFALGALVGVVGNALVDVGYRVEDCAIALQSMVDAGATPIDAAPRPGSRGTTVAFVHPKSSFGTLIELVQE